MKTSRRWSGTTKTIVILIVLILVALVIYRFRSVIPPLVISFLVAFILSPFVDLLNNRVGLSRGLSAGIVLLVLLLILVATPIAAAPTIQNTVNSAQAELTTIIEEIGKFLEQPPVEIFDYTIDLGDFYDEISQLLRSFVSSVAQETLNIAFDVASGFFWSIFILVVTYYLLKDGPGIIEQLDRLPPPDYRKDLVQLRLQITEVWHAFLRGELLLCGVIALVTGLACWAIGLPYAAVLGLVAGLLEVIPNFGPFLAAVPAVLLALIQGSSYIPLSNFWFAVLVAGVYSLIQQLENNLLVPRIMGHNLNLHPILVMTGVVVGGNLAGVLGMLLAAPVLSTVRVIGRYIFYRIYDKDPFIESERDEAPSKSGGFLRRAHEATLKWLSSTKEDASAKQVTIRPARAEDQAAVESICNAIWEQGDYVPQVWEDWVADPDGQLAVAERDGHVVGFGKLSRLEDDEWWLEGFRVDPAHQGQGIAKKMQTHLIDKACQMGNGTLRYGTSSLNEPIHRLSARHGFQRISVYCPYQAASLPAADGPIPSALSKTDVDQAWALIEDSPRYRAAHGLHEDTWQWKHLTRAHLVQYVEEGQAWGIHANGELIALALIHWMEEKEGMQHAHFGYIDGLDEALVIFLQGLRRLVDKMGGATAKMHVVDNKTLIEAIESAGYERSRNRDIWIFERSLADEACRTA